MTDGKLLCVLPVLWEPIADQCIASLLRPDSAAGLRVDEILVVDNSRDGFAKKYEANGFRVHRDKDGHNLGVARSWNLGVDEVLHYGHDYLLIMSSVMQFGPLLHASWRWQMEQFWGAKVIEAETHSWHLIALHRTCFERVGRFDTNFYPAYHEAEEWCLRLRLIGWEQGFVRVSVNALSTGVAAHLQFVECPALPLITYRQNKWGGDKGHEHYVLPWGNKPLDYFEDVPIPVLAERYGLGEYGVGWW